MEIKIVEGSSVDVQDKVNTLIKSGWELIGHVMPVYTGWSVNVVATMQKLVVH
jgi:hypothetical protein